MDDVIFLFLRRIMNLTLSELMAKLSSTHRHDPEVMALIDKIEDVKDFMTDLSEHGKIQCAQDRLFDEKPTNNIYQLVPAAAFVSAGASHLPM